MRSSSSNHAAIDVLQRAYVLAPPGTELPRRDRITIPAVALMPTRSAGILAFRTKHGNIEVLLVHPGGPFWRKKDQGAWSIPKGEFSFDEEAESAARREFAEELGIEFAGSLTSLGEVRQRGGKIVEAFAAELDVDVQAIRSNTFEIEWPPRSAQRQSFPEIDRAEWFDLSAAREKINEAQRAFLDRLGTIRGVRPKG